MSQDIFDSSIPASCPAVEIGVEQLYQAFKARLMRELVAKEPDQVVDKWDGLYHCTRGKAIPLVDKDQP